jgi:hypothetical protein
VVTVGEQVHPRLLQGRNAVVTKPVPNFTRLDPGRPEIAILMDVMLRAREVVAARPWSLSQEPTSEYWWADVLADPRARIRRQPQGYDRDDRQTPQRAFTGSRTSVGPLSRSHALSASGKRRSAGPSFWGFTARNTRCRPSSIIWQCRGARGSKASGIGAASVMSIRSIGANGSC